MEFNFLLDNTLSWDAKGLLCTLLAFPERFKTVASIIAANTCTAPRTRRILGELEDRGYVVKEKFRDDEGKFVCKVKVKI